MKAMYAVSVLAVSASVLAGAAVTANAAETVKEVYKEDFENISEYKADSQEIRTIFEVNKDEKAKHLTSNVLKYGITKSAGEFGYSKALTGNLGEADGKALNTYDNITIEFDMETFQASTDRTATVEMEFADTNNVTVFKVAPGTRKNWGTNVFTDGSEKTATINGTYFHFSIATDFANKTQDITITNLETNEIVYAAKAEGVKAENFNGFYHAMDGSWRLGYALIDNIVITTTEEEKEPDVSVSKLGSYTEAEGIQAAAYTAEFEADGTAFSGLKWTVTNIVNEGQTADYTQSFNAESITGGEGTQFIAGIVIETEDVSSLGNVTASLVSKAE